MEFAGFLHFRMYWFVWIQYFDYLGVIAALKIRKFCLTAAQEPQRKRMWKKSERHGFQNHHLLKTRMMKKMMRYFDRFFAFLKFRFGIISWREILSLFLKTIVKYLFMNFFKFLIIIIRLTQAQALYISVKFCLLSAEKLKIPNKS